MVSVADGRPRQIGPAPALALAVGQQADRERLVGEGAERRSTGSRHGARRIVGGLSMQADVLLPHPGADGDRRCRR